MPSDSVAAPLLALGQRAKSASRVLASSSTAQRNAALLAAAEGLDSCRDELLAANGEDLARATAEGADGTSLDRLRLDAKRVASMAQGLRNVAALADPVGEVADGWVRPNGLAVRRTRVPLGVVGIIYENRPNVTSDAGGLCLKSGNAVMLRGSSSAISSNLVVARVLREGLASAGLPADAVALVEDTSRASAVAFMQLEGIIDCLIPRGGPSLIASIAEHATVPYVLDGAGNCHVYVDASADLDMAEAIVVNAKTQRPGVCNAAETLLVHEAVADAFLPRLAVSLAEVALVADERSHPMLLAAGHGNLSPADDEAFATEFLGLTLAVGVVDDLGSAINHIARYSSGHSEAIVTSDVAAADRFVKEVDAAAVLVNASTRFIDGEELGLGAEIGISTQKLHARGPMGLTQLTTLKWIVTGNGQVRT